eukprot:TRINITY_DN25260_c0_g1_i3.p1 TRINITY_DN25260_c0_g1~~TRINITY_DN25260_c0_g1_i3.p1  ORF type:complete len:207 (+),score=36.36 TRINITY_DN25260_c0_g1_i3:89-709(+)
MSFGTVCSDGHSCPFMETCCGSSCCHFMETCYDDSMCCRMFQEPCGKTCCPTGQCAGGETCCEPGETPVGKECKARTCRVLLENCDGEGEISLHKISGVKVWAKDNHGVCIECPDGRIASETCGPGNVQLQGRFCDGVDITFPLVGWQALAAFPADAASQAATALPIVALFGAAALFALHFLRQHRRGPVTSAADAADATTQYREI